MHGGNISFTLSIVIKPKLESPTKERLPYPSKTTFNQHYSSNIKITGNNKVIAQINWQKNELCLESKILSAVFGNSGIVMHVFSISLWRMELPLPLSVMYCFPRIHTGSLVFGNTSCSKEIASYVVQAVSISRPAMFSFHLQFTKHRHFDSSTSRLKSKVLTHSTLEEQFSPNLVLRTRLLVPSTRLVQTCSKSDTGAVLWSHCALISQLQWSIICFSTVSPQFSKYMIFRIFICKVHSTVHSRSKSSMEAGHRSVGRVLPPLKPQTEVSLLNLFYDRWRPQDSTSERTVEFIYFVLSRCQNVGTTWSCTIYAMNGCTWVVKGFSLRPRASGFVPSADH